MDTCLQKRALIVVRIPNFCVFYCAEINMLSILFYHRRVRDYILPVSVMILSPLRFQGGTPYADGERHCIRQAKYAMQNKMTSKIKECDASMFVCTAFFAARLG